MMVVRLLWEQVDWVRFPAARINEVNEGCSRQPALSALGSEGLSDAARRRPRSPGISGEEIDSQQPEFLRFAFVEDSYSINLFAGIV